MKTIDIISATPELLISPFSGSIMKRAIEKEIVQVNFHDLKDYSNKKRKQIDDYQYGGGSGIPKIQKHNYCYFIKVMLSALNQYILYLINKSRN